MRDVRAGSEGRASQHWPASGSSRPVQRCVKPLLPVCVINGRGGGSGQSRSACRQRRSACYNPASGTRGCNSAGRVLASQASCRGFESHHPLRKKPMESTFLTFAGAVPSLKVLKTSHERHINPPLPWVPSPPAPLSRHNRTAFPRLPTVSRIPGSLSTLVSSSVFALVKQRYPSQSVYALAAIRADASRCALFSCTGSARASGRVLIMS